MAGAQYLKRMREDGLIMAGPSGRRKIFNFPIENSQLKKANVLNEKNDQKGGIERWLTKDTGGGQRHGFEQEEITREVESPDGKRKKKRKEEGEENENTWIPEGDRKKERERWDL